MHSAPAVSYPVGRSSFYCAVLAGLHGLGACVLLAWAVNTDTPRLGHLLGGLLWLSSLVLALWSWRHTPSGTLTWDGQQWIWTLGDLSHPVTLRVTLDLQHLMLMQLRAQDASTQWVCLARSAAPARWRACRRAVFARQPVQPTADADWVAP